MSARLLIPAVFLLSTAVLAFEILLLRIFAIETFHHFAHMAIGIALLGSGASGTALVLLGPRLRGREPQAFALLCALTALTLIVAPTLAHGLIADPLRLSRSGGEWLARVALYLILTTPFVASGAALAIALQLAGSRVGRVYAWSLIGSAAGTAASLVLLSTLSPARAVAVSAAPAAAAAVLAALGLERARARRLQWLTVATVVVMVLSARQPLWQPRIGTEKSLARAESVHGARRVAEDWGPAGWVSAVAGAGSVYAPGLSLAYRGAMPEQVALFVDAEAAGAATVHEHDPARLEFVHWLPASAAYAACDSPSSVLVIGAGGGLEVLVGLERGARSVTAIEGLRALTRVTHAALPAASRVYADPRVRLEIVDTRAFVAAAQERYDVIAIPPAGPLEQTAAVQDLGEDYLNTVEAYTAYLRRLAPGGVLAVTRWLRTPPRENVKVILTAGSALRAIGRTPTSTRLVFLRSWSTGTLLVKPDGFTRAELDRLDAFAAERFFDIDRATGGDLAEPEHQVLERPVYEHALRAVVSGAERAAAFARSYPLDVEPATDDRPYFGSFARLERVQSVGEPPNRGQLAVTSTVTQSAAAAALLLIAPLLVLRRRHAGFAPAFRPMRIAAYFAATGFGFVSVEIAAIQRLSLVLGHPVLAAAATIAALLAFSGLGSALSDRWSSASAARACTAVAAIALLIALTASWTGALNVLPFTGRATAALVLVALPGVALGVPFPLGLRRLAGTGDGVAWAWAASGVASVIGASVAMLIVVEIGSRGLIAIGAASYLLAALVARRAPARTARELLRDSTPEPGGSRAAHTDITQLRAWG